MSGTPNLHVKHTVARQFIWVVVSIGVGQVDHQSQLGILMQQILYGPSLVLENGWAKKFVIQRHTKADEPRVFQDASIFGIVQPSVRESRL